ncbi:hypothetical protein WJX75_009150 [Coccomyxa subellipsoidea]|uniref:Uncharacterized protein n=1 Tax=Coccomyxa subellipsoidea TaxID=248742 RepID=A0ABR2YEP2_9CHLO
MSPEASAEQWICTVSISILIRKAFAEDKESTFAVIICIIFKSHSSVQLLILNSPCCHSNDLEFKDILGKFLEEEERINGRSYTAWSRTAAILRTHCAIVLLKYSKLRWFDRT